MSTVDLRDAIATDLASNRGFRVEAALLRVLELNPLWNATRLAVHAELCPDAPSPAPGHRRVPATRPRAGRKAWVLRRRACTCGRDTAIHPNGALYRHTCRADGGLLAEEVTACATPP